MNTYTKLLRIGTQQYSPYIYFWFQTVFSPQIIILSLKSQVQIYTKRRIASKKQTLERKCVLQESFKYETCMKNMNLVSRRKLKLIDIS